MIGPEAVAMLIQISWLVCQLVSQTWLIKRLVVGPLRGDSPWSLTPVLVWLCLVACAKLHNHHIPLGKALLLKPLTGY